MLAGQCEDALFTGGSCFGQGASCQGNIVVKPAPSHFLSSDEADVRLSRYGLRVAARLSECTDALAPDISERLRVAREQAVERARLGRRVAGRTATSSAVDAGGTLTLGGDEGSGGFLSLLARWLPIALLVAGLIGIQDLQQRFVASATAEVDGDLLADDLPPAAYGDPGFAEFLKSPPAAAD